VALLFVSLESLRHKLFPGQRRQHLRPDHPLKTIAQAGGTLALSAMVAAVKDTGLLEAVSDDANSTMFASWRKGMDRALETIESMRCAVHDDLKRLVV
jgi:hypothetical protein